MKKSYRFKFLFLLSIVCMLSFGLANISVNAEVDLCETVDLPGEPVELKLANGDDSHFNMVFNRSKGDIKAGIEYDGWCIKKAERIERIRHTVNLYNSYCDEIPQDFTEVEWDNIRNETNYLINNKGEYENNKSFIQNAIWNLTDDIPISEDNEKLKNFVDDVRSNGSNFTPHEQDFIAILVKFGDDGLEDQRQRALFELEVDGDTSEDSNDDTTNGGTTNDGGSTGDYNYPPTASAFAGEPYRGYVDGGITFDGSRSYDVDGNIDEWNWSFGDGTYGSGRIVTHTYTEEGNYSVLLTVYDNRGKSDTYKSSAVVVQANRPPSIPTLEGVQVCEKQQTYTYNALSTDLDDDNIRYIFDWGDGTTTNTSFVANSTKMSLSHSWEKSGLYSLKVFTEDQYSVPSGTAEMLVYVNVDVVFFDEINGYIVDEGRDGVFDYYHNNNTGADTSLGEDDDGFILIDSDDDGVWNWRYDADEGLYPYVGDEKEETSSFFNLNSIFLIVGIIVVFLAALFWIRKR
ncbi:MAG: PKD domain-containing protein [Candidatus Thermoplasmatota archaeon]